MGFARCGGKVLNWLKYTGAGAFANCIFGLRMLCGRRRRRDRRKTGGLLSESKIGGRFQHGLRELCFAMIDASKEKPWIEHADTVSSTVSVGHGREANLSYSHDG